MTPVLSKWQCVKRVWAEKIINVRFNPITDNKIYWELANGEMIAVSNDLLCRGTTTPAGGYYVLYENGYESWSPAEAFEQGYIKMEES